MIKNLILIFTFLTLFSCGENGDNSGEANALKSDVVYGKDNRRNTLEHPNILLRKYARSVAVMVYNRRKKFESIAKEGYSALTYKKSLNLCPGSRFEKQPALGKCTGFLISDRVLLTAGHCVRKESACSQFNWVFDFNTETSYNDDIVEFFKSQIYSCEKIQRIPGKDIALITLNQPVTGREALPLVSNSQLEVDDVLATIGYPSGIPSKITDGGLVKFVDEKFFTTTLDTFEGNSGSPVFNMLTYEVEGVLVSGEKDYKPVEGDNCEDINRLENQNDSFEEVARVNVNQFKKYVDFNHQDENFSLFNKCDFSVDLLVKYRDENEKWRTLDITLLESEQSENLNITSNDLYLYASNDTFNFKIMGIEFYDRNSNIGFNRISVKDNWKGIYPL